AEARGGSQAPRQVRRRVAGLRRTPRAPRRRRASLGARAGVMTEHGREYLTPIVEWAAVTSLLETLPAGERSPRSSRATCRSAKGIRDDDVERSHDGSSTSLFALAV